MHTKSVRRHGGMQHSNSSLSACAVEAVPSFPHLQEYPLCTSPQATYGAVLLWSTAPGPSRARTPTRSEARRDRVGRTRRDETRNDRTKVKKATSYLVIIRSFAVRVFCYPIEGEDSIVPEHGWARRVQGWLHHYVTQSVCNTLTRKGSTARQPWKDNSR